MKRIWQTICGYIWWTYPRGSVHYDVMVTLILAFIFLTPLWVDFHDKPASRTPHPSEVVVKSDSSDGQGLVFEVDGDPVRGKSDPEVRSYLQNVIEPIAGEITVSQYDAVADKKGHVTYHVHVRRR